MVRDEIDRRFGRHLKALRKARGLSQEELSVLIERTSDTVSNLERGFSSTTLDTAYRLAKALGVPLSELFSYESDTPRFEIDLERARLLELLDKQPAEVVEAVVGHAELVLRLRKSLMPARRRVRDKES